MGYSLESLLEIGSNGEIGIRSIDAKITQTTNPIVNMTKIIGLWFMFCQHNAPCLQPPIFAQNYASRIRQALLAILWLTTLIV